MADDDAKAPDPTPFPAVPPAGMSWAFGYTPVPEDIARSIRGHRINALWMDWLADQIDLRARMVRLGPLHDWTGVMLAKVDDAGSFIDVVIELKKSAERLRDAAFLLAEAMLDADRVRHLPENENPK